MKKETIHYAALDLQKLLQKNSKIISSQDALKDIKPIEWGKDILKSKKKITITPKKD